jgi:hypothetical protein
MLFGRRFSDSYRHAFLARLVNRFAFLEKIHAPQKNKELVRRRLEREGWRVPARV